MQSRRQLLILAAVGIVATIITSGCSTEPNQAILPTGSTVTALGDSLPYGKGYSPDTACPRALAEPRE